MDDMTVHHIVSEISDHADFSWDGQSHGFQERAAITKIIKAALTAERVSATEECIGAIRNEALENPDNDEDRAYNVALNHAEYAIRTSILMRCTSITAPTEMNSEQNSA